MTTATPTTCPHCGAARSRGHLCPAGLEHVEAAESVLEQLEFATYTVRAIARRLSFGRITDAVALLEEAGDAINLAYAKLDELGTEIPIKSTNDVLECTVDTCSLPLGHQGAHLSVDIPTTHLGHDTADGKLKVVSPSPSLADRDHPEAAPSFRYAPTTSDAVTPPARAVQPKPVGGVSPGPLKADAHDPFVFAESPSGPPGTKVAVHEAFLFIEEDPILGNMPMHDAYRALLERLEKLADGEALTRCGSGHSWVAKRMPGKMAPIPSECAECGGDAVLIMGRSAIDVVRELAVLPIGHRLARCKAMHLWDADLDEADAIGLVPKELRMPDGRPKCPTCYRAAEIVLAGVPQ